jgi:ABC-type glycerol-3-phosphate transport system substrate-binding protein
MNMKKVVSVLLAVLLLISIAGCSNSKTPASSNESATQKATETASVQKKTVEFWMLPLIDEAKMKSMVDEFNAQSKTTQVNLTVLAWTDGREQIKQAVAAGSGPDVFYLSAGLDASLLDAQLLLPLDQNGYSSEDIAKYSSLIEASKVDGHLYAAPINYETYIMYYRTDIMKQYGFTELPKTMEELKDMAKTITEESGGKIRGFQFKGADDQLNAINYSWQTVLSQWGGNLMDVNDMKSTQNTSEGVAALEFMKGFYSEGISEFGTSANTAFREGVLASYCFTNGPLTSEGFVTDKEMEGKWTVGPMPAGPNDGGHIGGHALCVNSKTEKPENSVEFIKWLTSPANSPTWMTAGYGITPYNTEKLSQDEVAIIEEVYKSNPVVWDALKEAASKSSVEFLAQSRYGYTARWDAQKRLIISALNGEVAVEEALKQIDMEVNQSLN